MMKYCPRCGAPADDQAFACSSCGNPFAASAPMVVNNTDHTAEFDAKDISEGKVPSLFAYLFGPIGIIVALMVAKDSAFTRFHVHEAMKLTVCQMLLYLATALLFWTFIVPIVGGIAIFVLAVVQIICIVRVCKGQAKEAPIVSGLNFLK